jgi:RNA polymerase sigma-70 factor (TIGR02960 family)
VIAVEDPADGIGERAVAHGHARLDSADASEESRGHRFLSATRRVDRMVAMPARPKGDFEAVTASFRRELLAHCYRMTGSLHEAEDLVQGTYLRAWRAFDRFEQRSSARTWLYRIATNACLTALVRRRRRPLPSGLDPASRDPVAPAAPAPADVRWLEPMPDRLVVDERTDPAEVVAARHSLRLALVAGPQVLPSRQRAAFLLCHVLALPAAEVAEILEVSVPAVKSLRPVRARRPARAGKRSPPRTGAGRGRRRPAPPAQPTVCRPPRPPRPG